MIWIALVAPLILWCGLFLYSLRLKRLAKRGV
jgi:hypothetical protein